MSDFKMKSRHAQALFLGATLLSIIWLFSTRWHESPPAGGRLQTGSGPGSIDPNSSDVQGWKEKDKPTTSTPNTAQPEDSTPAQAIPLENQQFTSPAGALPEDYTRPAEVLKISEVSQYVAAIMDPADLTFSRLSCPPEIGARYIDLRASANPKDTKIQYFFALDLYEVAPLLPRLMGSIIQAIRFLGPSNCALSIVEGRSDDGTYQVLAALRQELESLGTTFHLESSAIKPSYEGGLNHKNIMHRITALSELRNMALAPLIHDHSRYTPDTVITFINDVALCPQDILELFYQHKLQNATMTCAFDWIHDGEAFYDVWVSRTQGSGNIFFEVTQDASWDYKWNLFWDDPASKDKFERLQPFQVYSCWGGLVTLDAKPFVSGKLAFRASNEGECIMGEPTLLAKDMWKQGLGRILAVPAVNVGYKDDDSTKIKNRRGYVHDNVDTSKPPEDPQTELVAWQENPPGQVKCLPTWEEPSWVLPV